MPIGLVLHALLLLVLFGSPGLVLFATAVGNGAARWPWPRGLTIAFAGGMAIAGIAAIGLGAFGVFGLSHECVAIAAFATVVVTMGGFRLAWPFARASLVEGGGFVVVATLAAAVSFGHPFEMLLGERDATVYTVSGIGLARQGSLVLRDRTEARIGPEAMRRFYPLAAGAKERRSPWLRLPQYVKYPGFYYLDDDRREVLPQGLPLLPALIAILYGTFGLDGAFATTNLIAVLAVLSVFAAGISLVGELAAALGASLLALDLIEVWAGGYSVAEILFQMLLFAAFAAYLRADRLGRGIAGFLLGSALFARVEAALLIAPIGLYAVVAFLRRRELPEKPFLWSYMLTALAGATCCIFFQVDYVHKSYRSFSSLQSRVTHNFFGWRGSYLVAGMLVITLLAIVGFAVQSSAVRRNLSQRLAGGLAIAVLLFVVFGYWIRPHMTGLVAGQGSTLIWLGWYVSPAVLLLGFGGLAHYLWTRANAENLLVLVIALTLSAVFLHFTFVNLLHIYMTRRFVPAALPLVLLFFAYAVATIGAGRSRVLGLSAAALMAGGSVYAIVSRSHHLYRHREYPALARQFTELGDKLRNFDLVFLSDGKARNLLGPALEFVYDIPTLVVWPKAYRTNQDLIRGWTDKGLRLGALTVDFPLENTSGAEDFEPVEHVLLTLHTLAEVRDRFPTEFWDGYLTLTRYAAGPGSHPLYEFWRKQGARISGLVCASGVRLLGGESFLVRQTRAQCAEAGKDAHNLGYLVGDAESAVWQRTLSLYGARFVRHDLDGVVLFDRIEPQADPMLTRLSPSGWKVEASEGRGKELLALDGRLDTRWGSGAPQRPGMTFTIEFPDAVDLGWLRLRMGHLATDRARGLALETSVDGTRWNRQEVPTVVDGIRWRDRIPEENADGDLDLWVNARGVRFLRLVNLGESSHFDWSIAELEIDGRPSGSQP